MHNRHSEEDLTQGSVDWSCREVREDGAASFTSIRQLLEPRNWLSAEAYSEIDLITLLNDLEFDLLQKRIQVDFLDALPPRVAYNGILQLLDTPVAMNGDAFTIQHLDGCDSACESCFQLAYCSVAREMLGKEWRLAVEQAGINPSWSALFAREDEL
jgi:hypothetical protein